MKGFTLHSMSPSPERNSSPKLISFLIRSSTTIDRFWSCTSIRSLSHWPRMLSSRAILQMVCLSPNSTRCSRMKQSSSLTLTSTWGDWNIEMRRSLSFELQRTSLAAPLSQTQLETSQQTSWRISGFLLERRGSRLWRRSYFMRSREQSSGSARTLPRMRMEYFWISSSGLPRALTIMVRTSPSLRMESMLSSLQQLVSQKMVRKAMAMPFSMKWQRQAAFRILRSQMWLIITHSCFSSAATIPMMSSGFPMIRFPAAMIAISLISGHSDARYPGSSSWNSFTICLYSARSSTSSSPASIHRLSQVRWGSFRPSFPPSRVTQQGLPSRRQNEMVKREGGGRGSGMGSLSESMRICRVWESQWERQEGRTVVARLRSNISWRTRVRTRMAFSQLLFSKFCFGYSRIQESDYILIALSELSDHNLTLRLSSYQDYSLYMTWHHTIYCRWHDMAPYHLLQMA